MIGTEVFSSGHGVWHPLVWLAGVALVWILTLILRSFGNRQYKPGTDQTLPFVSGDAVDPADLHIKASNLYWGFLESLKGYYRWVTRIHTGCPGDYVLWFLGITAAVLAAGLLT
jgi:hypothetical protein